MRPIFTIHAGEYLVGTKIEKNFPHLRVWVPSKDIGVDLLVTDADQRKIASLQVKFSKDYLATETRSTLTPHLESGGWWTLKRRKIADSPADLWIMVLYQFHTRRFDFVVIPPSELLARYDAIHGQIETIQSYIWVTKAGRSWETRGLGREDLDRLREGDYSCEERDLTAYLNVWSFGTAGHGEPD